MSVSNAESFAVSTRPAHSGQATASLVLGLVGIVAWLVPLFGYPVTIVGLVLGLLALRGQHKTKAWAGIILCIIFLVASVISSFIGIASMTGA